MAKLQGSSVIQHAISCAAQVNLSVGSKWDRVRNFKPFCATVPTWEHCGTLWLWSTNLGAKIGRPIIFCCIIPIDSWQDSKTSNALMTTVFEWFATQTKCIAPFSTLSWGTCCWCQCTGLSVTHCAYWRRKKWADSTKFWGSEHRANGAGLRKLYE